MGKCWGWTKRGRNNDQIPPVLSDGEEPEATSKPKQKMPRTKQRRGRGNLAERDDPESPEPDADDSVSKGQVPKVSMSSPVSLPKISIPREDMPKWAAGEDSEALPKKIPTLKIKIGWRDSLVSIGSDEAEFKSKKHRRSSLERAKSKEERKSSVDDEEVPLQKVPKLKIKLGQPPPSKVPDRETAFPPMVELPKEDIPPLLLRTIPTSLPRSAKGKVTPRPTPVEQTGGEHQGVSEPALEEEKEEDNDEKSLAIGCLQNTVELHQRQDL